MPFWERKDIQTAVHSMMYNKRQLEADNNRVHKDGTDNLYRYWRHQAIVLDEYETYRNQNYKVVEPKTPLIRRTRLPVAPKWKGGSTRLPKPYMTSKEKVIETIEWTPVPLSWD